MPAACQMPLAKQVRYAGTLTDCATGTTTQATLVLTDGRFSFTPFDGSLVISGQAMADGTFAGALTIRHAGRSEAPTIPPQSSAPSHRVEGQFSPDSVVGTYQSPRCASAFRLDHIPPTLLPWS
ncbi:MAG: hypothetical protein P4K98_06230 [Bryobacteraceae bacterium]|nr:hypothetical protein [Bryobacteraceae bacterium]